MKQSIISLLCGAWICIGTFSSCRGDVCYYFRPAEVEWMPYDTNSVAAYFQDEDSTTYQLQRMSRYFEHQILQQSEKRTVRNHHAYAQLVLDTVLVTVELYKEPFNYGSYDFDFKCDIQVGDMLMPEVNLYDFYTHGYVLHDSLQVGVHTYTNVYVHEIDTLMLYNANRTCWRIYYQKNYGLLRADFRNGHFYQIQ